MAYKQLVTPRLGTTDGLGWCLRFTQTVFAAPVKYPSARAAWDGQTYRHREAPPKGVAVPVWFDHTGTYGTPPVRKNWGHVAVSLGDGRYLTSPMNWAQGGQAIYPSMLALMRALGGNPRYLGWSETMNGKRVVKEVKTSTPSTTILPDQGDDDMIFIRRNTQSRVYAYSPLTGRKRPILTTEWNAIKRAYGAGKLSLPIIEVDAAEAKQFGI